MIISDLNYLENTSEEIFGGRGTAIANTYSAYKRVRSDVVESYTKTVSTYLGALNGNVAEAVFSADATGPNTFSSVIGGTQTETDRSETFVNAISATK
ncbi:MAG: hypothetical protein V7L25_04040 [Nostoc sp.]|uniref:hypothetical protein n=1 Tax=Nostoc sp. TaxID=1180 RepID=UPI002FF3A7FA